jgi:hypothetical protein
MDLSLAEKRGGGVGLLMFGLNFEPNKKIKGLILLEYLTLSPF